MEPHPLEVKLNAPASDILSAIERGFRAQIDVKGKLAALYLSRRLEALQEAGRIAGFEWQDVDGKPDFIVKYRGQDLILECKNIRNECFTRPERCFKVELQRTRNSKDGTLTRGYRFDEFDVIGVSLFNQTGCWDFLFAPVRRLERRPDRPEFLTIMQRVPVTPNALWTPDPFAAFDAALELRQ